MHSPNGYIPGTYTAKKNRSKNALFKTHISLHFKTAKTLFQKHTDVLIKTSKSNFFETLYV